MCEIVDGQAQFSGPWRDDLERAYRSSVVSDTAKQMLCSGTGLTAEDVVEVQAAMRACLADAGITQVEFMEYSRMSITQPAGMPQTAFDSVESACESQSGYYPISSLYFSMRQNPNKADVDQLIADCLVRAGLRPAGFTGQDVRAEYSGDDSRVPFADIADDSAQAPVLDRCLNNPLGLS